MAHWHNLVGDTISKHESISPILKKLMDLVLLINRTKPLWCKLRDVGARKPVQVVPTRWYTTSASINSILKLKDDLNKVPDDDIYRYRLWRPIISDEKFWADLEQLKIYFDFLSGCIARSEASNSLLSDSFRSCLELGKLIFRDLNATGGRFINIAASAYVKHFNKLNLPVLLTAYSLDPNQKLAYLTRKSLLEVKSQIFYMLLNMGYEKSIARNVKAEFDRFRDKLRSLSYIEDIYGWWDQANLPAIRIIGMRCAACHGSSANTERIFSSLRRILGSSRSRLQVQTINELMAIRINKASQQSIKKRIGPDIQTYLTCRTSSPGLLDDSKVEESDSLHLPIKESPMLDPHLSNDNGVANMDPNTELILTTPST